ncbi:MAG: Iron-sulfur cluster assembly protein SufB, partial [uncultured Friedmanniella sp.]
DADPRADHHHRRRPRRHGPDPGPAPRGPRPLPLRLVGLRRRRRDGQAGPDPRGRRQHLRAQERARVDARPAAQGPAAVRAQAHADLGRRARRHRLRQHQVLRPLDGEASHDVGRPAGRHQVDLRQAGHPGGREGPPGVRCGGAVRVRGRLPQDQRGARAPGRDLPRHRHRAEGVPGPVPRVLRHRDPGRGQQVLRAELRRVVGRLVHLRAEGRPRRDPAAGLLPDQHREHGPVRAHADHRRRGRLRALRRGLHRADLLQRLAALRRRGDRGQEGRPLPLHDHPELVEQRLQPRHQARHLRGGRDDGVDRRQHRLQGHHEVPGRLPDGRARQGRDPVHRLRRRGPAPGRRLEDGALRAAHLELDHLQVRGPWGWPDLLPRPRAGPGGCLALRLGGQVRRAAGRPDQPL